MTTLLNRLAERGVLKAILLLSEGPKNKSDFKRTKHNPEGIGSWETVERVVEILVEDGWVREKSDGREILYELTPIGERRFSKLKELSN